MEVGLGKGALLRPSWVLFSQLPGLTMEFMASQGCGPPWGRGPVTSGEVSQPSWDHFSFSTFPLLISPPAISGGQFMSPEGSEMDLNNVLISRFLRTPCCKLIPFSISHLNSIQTLYPVWFIRGSAMRLNGSIKIMQ